MELILENKAWINNALTEIIDKFAHYINDNRFDLIYRGLYNYNYGFDTISAFTDLLYENGINPIEHMAMIPKWFAYSAESHLESVVIPKNIKHIQTESFGPKLKSIKIEALSASDITISFGAFDDYSTLEQVICSEQVWEEYFKLRCNVTKWIPL